MKAEAPALGRSGGGLVAQLREAAKTWRLGELPFTTALPIACFEPKSTLEIYAHYVERPDLLAAAGAPGLDALARLERVVAYCLSTYAAPAWFKKPFNPCLGETLAISAPHGFRADVEQVSHHPPVTVMHIAGPDGTSVVVQECPKATFGGASVDLVLRDFMRVTVAGEAYDVVGGPSIRYTVLPPGVGWHGALTVRAASSGLSASVAFGSGRALKGKIKADTGDVLYKLKGRWDGEVSLHPPGSSSLGRSLWRSAALGDARVLADLSVAARVAPEVLDSGCERDSRALWREASEALRKGDLAGAARAKAKVESEARARSARGEPWHPRLFVSAADASTRAGRAWARAVA